MPKTQENSITVESLLNNPDVQGLLSTERLLETQKRLPWKVPAVNGDKVARLVEVELITTIPDQFASRLNYRLKFSDDSIAKCRIMSSPEKCARLCWISRNLPTKIIARMYSYFGSAMLEQWVEGNVLSSPNLDKELISKAANAFGRLHLLEFKQPYTTPKTERSYWESHCVDEIDKAQRQGVLVSSQASRISDYLFQILPDKFQTGVVHLDFCGENLVEREDGNIICIDNESVTFGVYDHDLARTKKRWNLSDSDWSHFRTHYGYKRSLDTYDENSSFWDTLVTLESARFHSVRSSPIAARELKLLSELLETI